MNSIAQIRSIIENAKDSESILNDPRNYAAIYARKSIKNDSGSTEAQVDLGREYISKNNLILYNAYIDKASAVDDSPYKREGFSKLMADARAGYFKNVVVYKRDRLARNLVSWIEIRNTFDELGIKILFFDNGEYQSDGTPVSKFVENLLMMVAELEPKRTKEKAQLGRNAVRRNGIYTSSRVPFGYIRLKKKLDYDKHELSLEIIRNINHLNIKSYFTIHPIQVAFVIYIFKKYNEKGLSEKDKNERIGIIIKSFEAMKKCFEKIKSIDDIGKIKHLEETDTSSSEYEFISSLKEGLIKRAAFLKKYTADVIKTINEEIRECIEYISKHGYIEIVLKNEIYAQCIFLYPKDKESFILNALKNEVDESKFIECINAEKVIGKELWISTICHIKQYKKEDKVSNDKHPFKSMLWCSKCKKQIWLHESNLFKCKNGCTKIENDILINKVFTTIIQDILSSKLDKYFTTQIKGLRNGISTSEKSIELKMIEKIKLTEQLIKNGYNQYISDIKTLEKKIHEEKEKLNLEQDRLYYISTLKESVDKIRDTYTEDKDNLIRALMKNELECRKLTSALINKVEIGGEANGATINYSRKIRLKSKRIYNKKRK